MTVRVVIADDQEIIRNGLRMILDTQDGIDVVGVAVDGRDAIDKVRQLRPDVCLFDIRMPDTDGIEATRTIVADDGPPVVIITTFDDDELVQSALQAGARGFLLKDADTELLVRAIKAAAEGESVIDPGIAARLLRRFAQHSDTAPAQPTEPLSDREEEVLLTVARGLTNAEIADELHISLSTVKAHVANLMTKLGARNRVEVAAWVYETHRL